MTRTVTAQEDQLKACLRCSARILRWLHRHTISGRTQDDPGPECPVPSLQQPQIRKLRCTDMPAHRGRTKWGS